MKHVLTSLCMRALIDQTTQNLTLVDVVDVLDAPIEENSQGALGVSLDLISMWRRDEAGKPETGRARVGVFGPDGKLVGQHLTYEVDLRTGSATGAKHHKVCCIPYPRDR